MVSDDAYKMAVYGVAVGDAFGLPVQFMPRNVISDFTDGKGITEMEGYGTFSMPKGTWSDDTSLTLALADSISLNRTVDFRDIMSRFVLWQDKGLYTQNGFSFDEGNGTRLAIERFKKGVPPTICGGLGINDNGNGSLMRIIPAVFYLYKLYGVDAFMHEESFKLVSDLSALTHGHSISKLACCIYCCFVMEILKGTKKENLLDETYKKVHHFYWKDNALRTFNRLFSKSFLKLDSSKINSSGYVVDTLEASIWCFMNTNSYKECIIKAVNLGEDTDTTGAVAGGICGAYYKDIPDEWLSKMYKMEIIDEYL